MQQQNIFTGQCSWSEKERMEANDVLIKKDLTKVKQSGTESKSWKENK